ncbi:hypothetical protein [Anthocerotibacter panamensis]|uniref:hypothetical protein n=1 Tax=Anthocerotibacter panamensis TaxID=2857077 RepID=UPI001C404395|nr:hypothetical protein [Anthocerotibacter panamensis]
MGGWLLLVCLLGSALLPVRAETIPIALIRVRDVGSTDLARQIHYVRIPDRATDQQIQAAVSAYAGREAKDRRIDELTVWIDLEAARDCEKLAGKPYFTYAYPTKTLKPGFRSRAEYLKTVAGLRAKGSCKPLY